jgi:hypothetical protein
MVPFRPATSPVLSVVLVQLFPAALLIDGAMDVNPNACEYWRRFDDAHVVRLEQIPDLHVALARVLLRGAELEDHLLVRDDRHQIISRRMSTVQALAAST